MKPFTIESSQDLTGLNSKLQGNQKAKLIAGGTNLLDLMKMYVETPDHLIDIADLKLDKIETLPNGGVRIAAMVTNNDLAYHPLIQGGYKMLSEALLSGASPQLRNMATTGGNILQRTRCPYFFNTSFPCNKRNPGSGCSAINGFNRSHAVLGTSDHCIATHPSDMCVAMAALDAQIKIKSNSGERSVPFTAFHLTPSNTPHIETVLKQDEVITSVELPPLNFATNSTYIKVRDRASYEFALTSAAVALQSSNGIITNARIALGGVGTKPWRSTEAENALIGKRNELQAYRSAADAALANAKPYKYNAFKIELAKRTIIRALKITGGLA